MSNPSQSGDFMTSSIGVRQTVGKWQANGYDFCRSSALARARDRTRSHDLYLICPRYSTKSRISRRWLFPAVVPFPGNTTDLATSSMHWLTCHCGRYHYSVCILGPAPWTWISMLPGGPKRNYPKIGQECLPCTWTPEYVYVCM